MGSGFVGEGLMVIMGMSWEPNRRITQRQWDVWRLVATGLTNREIAAAVGCSKTLIDYEIIQLYDKLLVPEGGVKRVKLALMFPIQER